jgi:hypothetical protein
MRLDPPDDKLGIPDLTPPGSSSDGSIPTILHHYRRLTRLTPDQAREAIVHPARQLGFHIDEALVESVLLPQLTHEGTVELPMLQIVCATWYQQAVKAAQNNADEATLGAAAYAELAISVLSSGGISTLQCSSLARSNDRHGRC